MVIAKKPANTGSKVKKADVKCRRRRFTRMTQQLCLQHHARGFGYKRISKATGIPISTIKYHVRKQRDSLDGGSGEGGDGDDHRIEHAATVAMVPQSRPAPAKVAPLELTKSSLSLSLKLQKTCVVFEKSAALVDMMHAVHDVIHKNVYALARALQFDSHGAPGLMNAADPQMLTLALNLLLQDPWAERQELAALGRILLQRLYRARDFLRSAISLCQNASPSSAATSGGSSPAMVTRYWECPVCSKRLVHTGKSAHLTRCLKKCKILLTHEQLQAAKAAAATAVAHSKHPEELKHQLKHALSLNSDDKCHQVRYMQLVVAVNTSLQQDIDTAPESLLESREAWRAVQCGPNPVVAALALLSLALQSQRSKRKKRAFVSNYAHDLASKVAGQIASVEAFLTCCVAVGGPSPSAVDAHDVGRERLIQQQQQQQQHERDEFHSRRITCSCHRVRISALIHPCVFGA